MAPGFGVVGGLTDLCLALSESQNRRRVGLKGAVFLRSLVRHGGWSVTSSMRCKIGTAGVNHSFTQREPQFWGSPAGVKWARTGLLWAHNAPETRASIDDEGPAP